MDEFGDLLGILPEDVLMEILMRLPVRNLLGLRCVCKLLCALVDHDYKFINRYYQFQYASTGDINIPSICLGPQFDIWNYRFMVSLLSIQNGVVPVELYHDFVRDDAPSFTTAPDDLINKKGLLVGGVKGVACILWGFRDFGLWNPATREFKPVTSWLYRPFDGGDLVLVGFGFDSVSDDFKIVRGTRPPGGATADRWSTVTYKVYSLATNSWKSVTGPSPFVRRCVNSFKTAYFNGFDYWVVYDEDVDKPAKMSILSFNFSTNAFTVFEGPQNVYDRHAVITMYKESLAIVVEDDEHSFHTWVVMEFDDDCPGIAKSWQHILTVGPFTSSDGMYFYGFRMDGKVLFISWTSTSEEESRLYNPSTGTFRNFGCYIEIVFNYVESLFPLSKRLM